MKKQLTIDFIQKRYDPSQYFKEKIKPAYATELGALFEGDCMHYLPLLKEGIADMIFADPPFNLGKKYGKKTNDNIPDEKYIEWCKQWIDECIRIVKPGGAIFIYNLPKWNILLGTHLYDKGMLFRHWIAIEISACLPIAGRLHPSHYSLLYYSKGKPKSFQRIRTPIQTCRHCGGEVKDYGGHRGALNPKGITLKDVWTDIPPVRHWKFKSKERQANALSTKLVERTIEMSTKPGELVIDPFGGSGTTYACCEYLKRCWLGIELDFVPEIIDRLKNDEIHPHKNDDYVER